MLRIKPAFAVVAVVLVVAGAGRVRADDATLEFARDGKVVQHLDHAALAKDCGVRTITIDDPYYGRKMSLVACPLGRLLEMGFGLTQVRTAAGQSDKRGSVNNSSLPGLCARTA